MKSIIINLEKTTKQKLFGGVFMLFSVLVFLYGGSYLLVLLFILIGLFFSGFNIKVFSLKLNFSNFEYVSLNSKMFNGFSKYLIASALGTTSLHNKIVLKLFKDNQNTSIYTEKSYQETLNRANFINNILSIELCNPIEDNE